MMDKSAIRKEIRARKSQFTVSELREQSRCVMERLLAHPRILSARTILMYYSLPDEVYTADALDALVSMGKKILLPTVVNDEEMVLSIYENADSLCEGAFHIMEPQGIRFDDYGTIDLAVIPGMAFDRKNNRLGRGKGYYDRFLAKIPDVYKIGICFDFQKIEMLPVGEHDIRMDEVL